MQTFHPSERLSPQLLLSPFTLDALPSGRIWQGIPSLERSPRGRLFTVFYSGMSGEQSGNFVVLAASDDDGRTWTDPVLVVRHEDPQMRVFDPNVWLDPLGRLWLTWAQSRGFFDGRDGVWAIRCDRSDDLELRWSEPQRIAHGVMMNKPTVLRSGAWLFPCAVWVNTQPGEDHPEVAGERFSNVYCSNDQGETFTCLGGADVPARSFDEHSVVELNDGRLWMLVRCTNGTIGESFSSDGGRTWSPGAATNIANPDARFFIRRLRSGRLLLVNHVDFTGRNNLAAQLSEDDGRTWIGRLMLDERAKVSYPDGTEDASGNIYIVHDRERYGAREILMSRFTEADILAGRLVSEGSRLRQLVSKATGEPAR